MAWLTKTCLTCGKMMPAGAQFCSRCGGAFLRVSNALPDAAMYVRYGETPPAQAGAFAAAARNLPLLGHTLAWYAGNLVRRTWLFLRAIW